MAFLFILMGWGWFSSAEAALSQEQFQFNGDFRYRHQFNRIDGQTQRHFDRLRARLGVNAKVNEEMRSELRLGSGELGQTTVTGHQTLGDAGEKKAIWIDRANVSWTPTDKWQFKLGKMGNPWWTPGSSEMVFNGEYTPEGFSGIFTSTNGEHETFVNLNLHWLKERAAASSPDDSADSGFFGLQAGGKCPLGRGSLKMAAGLATTSNLKGHTILGAGGDPRGNSTDTIGADQVYRYNYDLISASAEWTVPAGGRPLALWAEWAQNSRIGKDNQAYDAGIQYGSTAQKGDWSFGYLYREVNADALLAVLIDSAFGGGNSDSRGHGLNARYAVMENATLSLAAYDNDFNLRSDTTHFRWVVMDFSVRY